MNDILSHNIYRKRPPMILKERKIIANKGNIALYEKLDLEDINEILFITSRDFREPAFKNNELPFKAQKMEEI